MPAATNTLKVGKPPSFAPNGTLGSNVTEPHKFTVTTAWLDKAPWRCRPPTLSGAQPIDTLEHQSAGAERCRCSKSRAAISCLARPVLMRHLGLTNRSLL